MMQGQDLGSTTTPLRRRKRKASTPHSPQMMHNKPLQFMWCSSRAGQPVHPEILSALPCGYPLGPVIFDSLDGATIRTAALHTNGCTGPSGIDAKDWRCLCTSFQNASTHLCNSVAMVTHVQKLCTTYGDPQPIAPLTTSHLIALDKCPIGSVRQYAESSAKPCWPPSK